jgi:putative SOS response-associated peptidase YedK
MCGRFAFFSPAAALQQAFGVGAPVGFSERYNIAPTQQVHALLVPPEQSSAAATAVPEWRSLRWGLVPFWAKDKAMGNRMINARAETIATKPAFRGAFKRQRCVVAASGFYEWHTTAGTKTPWYISRADESPLALAGIWDTWNDATGQPLHTCSIITAPANSFMSALHHRMPVILERAQWAEWFAPLAQREDLELQLLAPQPVELQAWAVSRAVNSPANESPQLVEPA